MPIIFVHGITVRLDGFNRLLGSVQRGLTEAGCASALSGCYWGDYGRAESYTGMSIPGFAEGVRAIGDADSTPDTKAVMMLLLEDPLAELADLKDRDEFGLEQAGPWPVPPQVDTRNAALSTAEKDVAARLISGLAELDRPHGSWHEEDVRQQVSDIFAAAAGADRELSVPDLREPMERALTATMYRITAPTSDWPGDFPWNQAAAIADDAFEQSLGGERGRRMTAARNRALTYALRRGMRAKIMPSR